MIAVPREWWHDLFTDLFVELWLQAVPAEQTRAETAFLQKMLRVPAPTRLLDAPCGGGRHALVLAAAGYRLTGLDVSAEFLAAARQRAAEQQLPIDWVHASLSDITWQNEFDGAYCFGNCFGYDDDAGNAAYLRAVYRSLKPGGRLVVDYPMVLEALLPRMQSKNWCLIGDIYFLEDEQYDPVQGRYNTEYTLIRGDKVIKRHASHRCYTYREVWGMLAAAGFTDIESHGSLTEEPFKLGSTGLYLVGTRPKA